MSCNAVLVELYFCILLLSEGLLILPSILTESLVGRIILITGLRFSLLGIHLAIPFWRVVFLLRNMLLALLELPGLWLPLSPLLPLRVSLCLRILPFWLWCVLDWASLGSSSFGPFVLSKEAGIFSHQVKEVFCHTFSERFSIPYSPSSSGTPIIWILLHFMLYSCSLNPSYFFLCLFVVVVVVVVALFGIFFYLVLQLTDLILCFI